MPLGSSDHEFGTANECIAKGIFRAGATTCDTGNNLFPEGITTTFKVYRNYITINITSNIYPRS